MLVAGFAGLTFFLFSTNPRNLPVGVLILPFVALFLLLYLLVYSLMTMIVRQSGKRSYVSTTIALIVAGIPTLLLVLQSINQLSWRDILLLLAFGVCALVYTAKFNSRPAR